LELPLAIVAAASHASLLDSSFTALTPKSLSEPVAFSTAQEAVPTTAFTGA